MTACIKCLGLAEPDLAFRIRRKVSSANLSASNRGGGSWAYRAQRTLWIDLLNLAVREWGVTPATARRVVRITREYSGRRRQWDYGNFVGGLKPIIDAMTREVRGGRGRGKAIMGAGIVVDDSEKWMLVEYVQRRTDGDEEDALLFEIWELA